MERERREAEQPAPSFTAPAVAAAAAVAVAPVVAAMPPTQPTPQSNDDGLATIRVKMLSDGEFTVRISLDASIADLRERIHEHMGMDPQHQRIIFQGRVLDQANNSLASYGLQDEYAVHLIDLPINPEGTSSNASRQQEQIRAEAARRPRGPEPPENDYYQMMRDMHEARQRMQQERANQPALVQSTTIERSRNQSGLAERTAPRTTWRFAIESAGFAKKKDQVEAIIRRVISEIPYLTESDIHRFRVRWLDHVTMRIDLPEMQSHIAQPAFERLLFVENHVNLIRRLLDTLEEEGGIMHIVRQVLELVRKQDIDGDGLTDVQRRELFKKVELQIVQFETINGTLPANRRNDQTRVRSSTPVERGARFEQIEETEQWPPFVLRHSLATDLTQVLRDLRVQQRRFFDVETLLDEMIEMSAIEFVQGGVDRFNDYRSSSLSVLYNHVQRLRHHFSHLLHIVTEIEVPFLSPSSPQTLLPQYCMDNLIVRPPHLGSLIIEIRNPTGPRIPFDQPISEIFEPPRSRTDVGLCLPGEWPYITYFPTGLLLDLQDLPMPALVSLRANPSLSAAEVSRQVAEAIVGTEHHHHHRRRGVESGSGSGTIGTATTRRASSGGEGGSTSTPAERRRERDRRTQERTEEAFRNTEDILTQLQIASHERTARIQEEIDRHQARLQQEEEEGEGVRIFINASRGTTNLVPAATVVPTTTAQELHDAIAAVLQTEAIPPPPPENRPSTSTASLPPRPPPATANHQGRGPETRSLHPYPVRVTPDELSRISKTITSRYRDESLRRIASALDSIFSTQFSWDIRLSSAPAEMMREMLAIALQLLSSTGRNVEESKHMMFRLVQDEDFVVRALTEAVKALFVDGDFPTHMNRFLSAPREERAPERTDNESRDGDEEEMSDEADDQPLRVASDVSQPQSGSLRDIANQRAARRRAIERRNNMRSATAAAVAEARPASVATARPAASPTAAAAPATRPASAAAGPAASSPADEEFHRLGGDLFVSVRSTRHDMERPAADFLRSSAGPSRSAGGSSRASPASELPPPHARLMFQQLTSSSGSSHDSSPARRRNGSDRRQAISVDPFLACTSRLCDTNRVNHAFEHTPNSMRVSERSMDPDPMLTDHQTRCRLARLPDRQNETARNDPEFQYSVRRHRSGELMFSNDQNDRERFATIMRTAIRSLFGAIVESDAVTAISELHDIPTANGRMASRTSSSEPGPRAERIALRDHGRVRPAYTRTVEQSTALIRDYIIPLWNNQDPEVGRVLPARGMAGLALDLLRGRVENDRLIPSILNMEDTVGNMQIQFRLLLIERYLNGNARPSDSELQAAAEAIALDESTYDLVLQENPEDPSMFLLVPNGTPVNVARGFRTIEVFAIRQFIETTMDVMENRNYVTEVMATFREYQYRMGALWHIMLCSSENNGMERRFTEMIRRLLLPEGENGGNAFRVALQDFTNFFMRDLTEVHTQEVAEFLYDTIDAESAIDPPLPRIVLNIERLDGPPEEQGAEPQPEGAESPQEAPQEEEEEEAESQQEQQQEPQDEQEAEQRQEGAESPQEKEAEPQEGAESPPDPQPAKRRKCNDDQETTSEEDSEKDSDKDSEKDPEEVSETPILGGPSKPDDDAEGTSARKETLRKRE